MRLYLHNRLDELKVIPDEEIIEQFIQAVLDPAYEPPGRSLRFAFRLWLTGSTGLNATADEDELVRVERRLENTMIDGVDRRADQVIDRIWSLS